ncbi:hypothetical protein [Tautonia rosea]|uniref:hypothetical protein n=1 Tax=Tautonia rosea TaxID=2728037 RepID=UPI0014756F62|nr:hypothetical protein [Tautonia rosea]
MPPLLWAEFSIQYLVPAIFLVIWALNQVFGKAEAPQPPVRERIGPRPVPPGGPSRAPQTPSRAPRGNAPERSRTSPGRAQSPRDTNRCAARSSRSQPKKAEETASPPNRVGESPRTPRPVPADIQQVYAIYDDARMDEAEIQRGLGPISAEATRGSQSRGAVLPPGLSAWANLGGEQGVNLNRLREAIILSEILTPPPSVARLRQASAGRPMPLMEQEPPVES